MTDKKRYSKEEKAAIISECDVLREMLSDSVLRKRAIPQEVVNAPLSKIIEYKENCEKIGNDYHLKNGLTKSLSGKKILEVMAKLKGYLQLVSVKQV